MRRKADVATYAPGRVIVTTTPTTPPGRRGPTGLASQPAHRFPSGPDFPFRPRFCNVVDAKHGPLRVHYIDEGPSSGPTVVLLHGEPTWSYLFRRMIGPLTSAGCRCIAIDLIGFGRSDKPTDPAAYTYRRQVGWLTEILFEQLSLNNIVLCCHDWGGMLGLRVVADHPRRFSGVVATNTALPTGREPIAPEVLEWVDLSQAMPDLAPSEIIQSVVRRRLSRHERVAYDAPFPDRPSGAGLRALPTLIPLDRDDLDAIDNAAALDALGRFRQPFATVYGAADPFMAGWQAILQRCIPGAVAAPHRTLEGVGMFVPEDAPGELVECIVSVVEIGLSAS